jgi:ribosome-associated toxin RatA of RatAB toxin-antitoxin module
MPDVKKTAVLPYSASQMFNLVNAIEDYPQFIPYCKSAQILSLNEDEIKATVDFARGSLQKSFTTVNRLQKDKMIEIRLLEGPFRHLQGFWLFEQQPNDSCQITLDLDFEFKNRLLGFAFEPLFLTVANKLVEAFSQRADVIYGGIVKETE